MMDHTSFEEVFASLKTYREEAKIMMASEIHAKEESFKRLDWFPGKSGREQYQVFHHQLHMDSTYNFHTLEEAVLKYVRL